MTRERLTELYPELELTFLDGLDSAILGVVDRHTFRPVVLYSTRAIIELLQERDGMSYEDALEFFDFNIGGLWAGDTTPAFLADLHDADEDEG